MIRTRVFCAGSAIVTILSAQSLARAADYYFDTAGGDDGKDGTSEATAKKTFKMPSGTGNTVHIKRGSSISGSLNISNVTVTTFGCGPRVVVTGSVSVNNSTVDGLNSMPTTGNGFNIQSNSTVRDCEVDGTNGTSVNTGFGINGQNNLITGNYVHDLANTVASGNMNTSGGAEAFMVMASNNEVSFNSAYNCQGPNSTLGGFEGGCLEIVDGAAKAEITNVNFHHNYCEKSVGLFEASSGNFSGTDQIMDPVNHGKVNNITVSYNISVDSMWLFLLQPVNTDFQNVVFANNTIIHTPSSKTYWTTSSQSDTAGGHEMMALAVATDSSTGTTYTAENQYYSNSAGGFLAGSVIMKNNLFIDNVGGSTNFMFGCNVTDHSNNVFVPSNANLSSLTLDSTEKKVNLADLALTSDYRLTSASAPAIDQGVAINMATDATASFSATEFSHAFVEDVDHHSVPCGSAPDVGASEYCSGTSGSVAFPGPATSSSCAGTGGSSSAGGSSTVATGGKASTGGASSVATGGKVSTGGGSSSGTGGASSAATGGASVAGATNNTGGAVTSGGGTSQQTNTGGANQQSNTGGAGPQTNTGGASTLANAGGQAAGATGGASAGAVVGGANTGTAPAGSNATGPAVDQGGCSCSIVGSNRGGFSAAFGAIGLALLALGRRRRSAR